MKDKNYENVQGISDLLFEMMYGSTQDLYSNSILLLESLNGHDIDLLRLTYIKLVNNVDTSKLSSLFEHLCDWLKHNDNEKPIQLFKDILTLKTGRRVN
jgi:hypothetical protein